ncbi:CGNR zinc finger domain-containing protein [Streptomyces sp. H27-D2]|uniref:CGNR zinc finger domain-containing protein n=1 Tax=Streptomyces sp. H27-D2 TaxID=3046304 RepID=UPI002DBD33DC|nr:CGNR zinc finger domain-containing protein [Streptomyces sp. H27-D2]MEC4018768.1 CGNR zinc finger domain-containing protein [Streptomyces sp. H27-D2]
MNHPADEASAPGGRAPAPRGLALLQDLANTLDTESGRDELTLPGGLAAFARERGLAGLGLGDADVAPVVELREALRDVCLAHTGRDLPPASAAALERLLGRAPLVLTIDATGGAALRPAPRPAAPGPAAPGSAAAGPADAAAALTARIAAGIAAAVADGSWARLKACEAEDCHWVYYDRSPAGRGRWCSMAVCGSRAKMRAYRANRARPKGD